MATRFEIDLTPFASQLVGAAPGDFDRGKGGRDLVDLALQASEGLSQASESGPACGIGRGNLLGRGCGCFTREKRLGIVPERYLACDIVGVAGEAEEKRRAIAL